MLDRFQPLHVVVALLIHATEIDGAKLKGFLFEAQGSLQNVAYKEVFEFLSLFHLY